MSKLRSLLYIIKQSLENLLKNWYMLLASVFVLFTGMYTKVTWLGSTFPAASSVTVTVSAETSR